MGLTKKEINPTRVWTSRDEFGSGAKDLKLDKVMNRMSDKEKEQMIKNTSAEKFNQKWFVPILAYLKSKDIGGPDGVNTPEKHKLKEPFIHALKYVGLMVGITGVFMINKAYTHGHPVIPKNFKFILFDGIRK